MPIVQVTFSYTEECEKDLNSDGLTFTGVNRKVQSSPERSFKVFGVSTVNVMVILLVALIRDVLTVGNKQLVCVNCGQGIGAHHQSVQSLVRGWSCEPNNLLNVCTTSVTEGEVVHVKLV